MLDVWVFVVVGGVLTVFLLWGGWLLFLACKLSCALRRIEALESRVELLEQGEASLGHYAHSHAVHTVSTPRQGSKFLSTFQSVQTVPHAVADRDTMKTG
jgi:hypothetical protein